MIAGVAGTSALITDIDRRKALPIIRSLGKEGVRIIGISSERLPMGAFSKYCAKVYRCSGYRDEPYLFLEELEKICKNERPDVFYPIEDVVLSLCAQNPYSWNPYTHAVIPSPGVLERAYDKWETIRFARELGIPVPKTDCPESIDKVRHVTSKWKGQAVIKPRKSSGSRGLRYVEDPSQMFSVYQEVSREYPRPLIQERIPSGGEGLGVFVLLSDEHETLAVFGHKRLREFPVSGGPSTLRVSHRDDKLIEQTISLFKSMGLVGVAMAEYKLDLRTNEPVLLEINPRFWGSLELAICAGVNFPVLYHKTALALSVEPILDYATGKYCRWLWPGDILHFLCNPKRFDLQPSFFKFWDSNVSYDIISADDPLPMLGILLEGLRKLARRVGLGPL